MLEFRAEQGLFNGGYPRLGYDIDEENKGLKLNKEEAPVVKEIFNVFLQEGSLSRAAIYLNNNGYRTKEWTTRKGIRRGGSRFNKMNLSNLLHDPIFIGKIKQKGKVYEGVHEATLDEDTWNQVQDLLNSNRRQRQATRPDGYNYLLKSLLKCGHCGSYMIPVSSRGSKGQKYFYYRCVKDQDPSKGKCPIGLVTAPKFETFIIDQLKVLSKDPNLIKAAIENSNKASKATLNPLRKKRKGLERKLETVNAKANRILESLAGEKGTIESGFVVKKLDELQVQKDQLAEAIDKIDFKVMDIENTVIDEEFVINSLKEFDLLWDALKPSEKYDLIHLLVKEIEYEEDLDSLARPANSKVSDKGEKSGTIRIRLYDLGPGSLQEIKTPHKFVRRKGWLLRRDSNPRQGG